MKQHAYFWLTACMIALTLGSPNLAGAATAQDSAKTNKEAPSLQTTQFAMVNQLVEPNLSHKFPADTLQQFLKLYGKDSLMHQLDQRINLTKKHLLMYTSMLNDEHAVAVLQLVSKQYKLGFDTLKYPYYKADGYFLKLYGRTLGNVYKSLDTAKIKTMTADQFHDMYVGAFKDSNILGKIALPLAIVAPYINVSKKTVEALIKHYGNLYFPESPYYLYYALREYGSNSAAKNSLVGPYVQVLADSLYANNNFPKAMDKQLAENNSAGYYQDFLRPMRFLAYGLYAGDITVEKNGLDLMYLLAAQRTDGGWYSIIGNNKREYNTTIYGLWALCEFRAKLAAQK